MDLIEDIAKRIEVAALTHDKSAVFHFSVLTNAIELRGMDPIEFCRGVGMPDSYHVEFRKMIKLAEIIKQMGMRIGPA